MWKYAAIALALAGCSVESAKVAEARGADQRFRTAQQHGADLREVCGLAREASRAWLEAAATDPDVAGQYEQARLTAGVYCRRADQEDAGI